jgi:hypothetical protein
VDITAGAAKAWTNVFEIKQLITGQAHSPAVPVPLVPPLLARQSFMR